MITRCFTLLLILSLKSQAAVIKHDILNPKFEQFSFREVCKKLGSKNLELIDAKSQSEIDCMGKIYPAIDFCLDKFPLDKTLTRAVVDATTKQVKCEMSASVMVSVSCDKADLKYCLEPEKGCEQLKKIYANRLSIAHFSMLEKNLNCYFARPYGESLNESR
jgi:hypothetical protein